MRLAPAGAIAAALLVSACSDQGLRLPSPLSGSAQSGSASASAYSTLTAADRAFIMEAAEGGIAEVRLAQIAQQKASNSAVREFARMMIEQHTQANRELMAIADRKGMAPPSNLESMVEASHRPVIQALESASGPAFDRQYVQQQMAAHGVQHALFEFQADQSRDPDLRQFAQRYAPVIRQHMERLRSLAPQVMGSR